MKAAVLLAVDPGKRGGWCIVAPSGYRISGTATRAEDRRDVLLHANTCASANEVPIVAVVERWTAGSSDGRGDSKGVRWNAASMIGTGSQRGRWLEALEIGGVPATRVV